MRDNNSKESNFWVVYANLMAGLFFVFLLIIGAVIVKYVLSQNDLKQMRESLNRQEHKLNENQRNLKDKEHILFSLDSKINDVSNEQKQILEYNLSQDLNSSLNDKDKQIVVLLAQLDRKDLELENLELQYENIATQVKNLSLIKTKIIDELKASLDSNVTLDLNTGAIILPSEILFDKGSYILKNEVKGDLKKILSQYFDSILNNENILLNIENIIIEGHTDTDGSYMYNLDLSQRRAYEIMSFIYTFYRSPKLQKLLVANGRSFADPIFVNGKEDKEKNERIVIKFSISNEALIRNIKKTFDSK